MIDVADFTNSMPLREFEFFKLLHDNLGKCVMESQFMDHIYGAHGKHPHRKIIQVYVCRIRKRLPKNLTIRTVYGRGYIMQESDGNVSQS